MSDPFCSEESASKNITFSCDMLLFFQISNRSLLEVDKWLGKTGVSEGPESSFASVSFQRDLIANSQSLWTFTFYRRTRPGEAFLPASDLVGLPYATEPRQIALWKSHLTRA